MGFQVKALFTCDRNGCGETAEVWTELEIESDTEHDSYGGSTTRYHIHSRGLPDGWIAENHYGVQNVYCSYRCSRNRTVVFVQV